MTETLTEPQAETAPTEPTTPDDTSGSLVTEVEKWKALARKNEARAKENAEKAKEYDAFKASQMTELEKAQQEAADLKARLEEATTTQKQAELSAIRARVGVAKGLPAALIDRLQGEDEDSIAADAEALLASLPKDAAAPRVDIGQGDRGTSPASAVNPLEAVLRNKLGM